MKKITSLCVLLMILTVEQSLTAQSEPPIPVIQKMEAESVKQASEMSNRNKEAANSTPTYFPRTSGYPSEYSGEELVRLRSVNPEDEAKYKTFLADGKGGLFRLFPDFDCTTHFLLRADGDCASAVEASSGYSFRSRSYNDNDSFNDIRLNQNKIINRNFFFSLGAIVSLGDTPLENVQLSNEALKFLIDLEPPKKYIDACDMAALLKDGIKVGNQTYSDSVTFSQNNTYAIRVIAYKLPLGRFPATSGDVLAFYNDRGKRADLIVIFRGIRQDEDGSVTILWKELSRKKARSISFGKYEKVGDFRTPTVRK